MFWGARARSAGASGAMAAGSARGLRTASGREMQRPPTGLKFGGRNNIETV